MNPVTKMMKRYIKMPLKKALPLLFVSAILLISITGCTSPSASPTPTASSAPTAQPTKATASPTAVPKATATPAATATTSGQGTASNNDWSLTARNQGTYTSTNQFIQPTAGDKYVQIYVELTNKDATNALMGNPFQFTLFDNKNIGHQAATPTFGAPNSLQSLQNSNPGDKVAGIIIFEMPAGNTPTKVVYQPGLLSSSLTVTL
ncbi:MAG: DUF4352 domain-containing protein [Halobacteriota archaeon]